MGEARREVVNCRGTRREVARMRGRECRMGEAFLRYCEAVNHRGIEKFLAGALSLLAGAVVTEGADRAGLYEKEIKPVLRERCFACHGALKQKADLRVDTVRSLIAANALVPGNSHESEIVRRITASDLDERMPPEGHALSSEQVAAIRMWIDGGAPAPEGELPEDDPWNHWAFQPIHRPSVPEVAGVVHPVDSFLLAKLQDRGLQQQPEAERGLVLRRLYLDLIGLPPTPEQLADTRPWEEIVDELLASPHHGERWARHWMDVWRYSDWYGLGAQLRYSQKHLWHWRDWIVDSLNEDKGYDRMIREMLAGDEIAPDDPDTVRATGFLARNYFLFNRTTWLDSTIEHTGKAFLGLTLNCAKCHDHKYDPIDMVDYYSLRAVFEPHQVRLDPVPGVADLEKNGLPRVFDDQLEAVTQLHRKGDPKQPDDSIAISPAVPAFLSSFAPPIEEVSLPRFAYAPGSRDSSRAAIREQAAERVGKAEKALADAHAELAKGKSRLELEKETSGEMPAFSGFRDDFTRLDPTRWKVEGEGLAFRDGKLEQVTATRSPGQLILQQALPTDFEMTCRYTTTGGPTYRSVTFRFHRDEKGENANYVYTSEHAPGPKVQAAYSRNGKSTYPADGRKKKLPTVGKPQELRVAVRDRLVNVWLDGEFVLAYRYPGRHEGQGFSLSAFDATAVFHSLEIRALERNVELTEAKNDATVADPETLASEVQKAEKVLEAARREQEAIEATIVADDARHSGAGEGASKRLAEAARAQVLAKRARAEADLLVHAGDAKKRKDAEARRKKAEALGKAVEEGGQEYEPLRVSRKALETPAHKFDDYPGEYPERSTGRRTMLANWIASDENPLTARVAVNHVWMRHFGEPLVASVFDFGRQAERPEHAELLDFLAAEFIESGWSFHSLHRILLTSRAFRSISSTANADSATFQADPQNRLYWRMNTRRMESQVVRDSLLHLAGTLDLTLGGPSVDPNGKSNRRSLYFTHSPDKLNRFLTSFDEADLQQCYRRSESVVPQQALALANSALALESASAIASRIEASASDEAFVEEAFTRILARPAAAEEVQECMRFLADFEALGGAGDKRKERARIQLVHALLNHNDFITIR